MRLDALLIPATLAILVHSEKIRAGFREWLRFWPLLFATVILLTLVGEGTFWQLTLLTILLPLMVLGAVLNPQNPMGRILEWAPLRYIGRISYSLYLWQQLFFVHHSHGEISRWAYWSRRPYGLWQHSVVP
jgi:peptidoglycan/LPS O-acetylase OafA/YrhL